VNHNKYLNYYSNKFRSNHFIFFKKNTKFTDIKKSIQFMSRCKQCDYPYASLTRCTNCGSTNPTGKKGTFVGGLITVLILVALTKCS
jgi:hypothetical protein